jgi:hypothetical protein
MSKKSDDSIDRIFRQALTQYDTKFHEDDWLKMEKLLNEEAQRQAAVRSKRIKGTAYTLTGLTVLFIVVYFLANKNPSGSIATLSDSITEMRASEALTDNGNVKRENPSEGLLSQSNPNESTKAGETESTDLPDVNDSNDQSLPIDSKKSGEPSGEREKTPDAQRSESGVSNNSAYGRSDETNVVLQKPGSRFSNQKANERAPSFQTEFGVADKPGLEPSNKSNPSLTSRGDAEIVEAVDDKLSRSDDGPGDTNLPATSGESGKGTLDNHQENRNQPESNSGTLVPEKVEGKSVPLAIDSASIAEEVSKTTVADSVSVVESLSPDDSKSKPSSRWSVAFVIAPEFSTTKLTSYSSPGESYGLRIGYQLSNRFSVNTGIIRSQKKYEGSGEGYSPRNPAYWQIRTNGVVPEEIYSKCLVYELPLGVQFNAIQTSKSRVFVSTAISSYFMISQAYDYTFQSPNPGADTGWRSRGSESYWFSVGMVSAGYERYITRSFAIGIEPYLKISLSEIGWPNIKLYSTGAYVTLRYKFMSRRNF